MVFPIDMNSISCFPPNNQTSQEFSSFRKFQALYRFVPEVCGIMKRDRVMNYVMLVMATLSLGLTSCGDDDGPDKDIAANQVPAVVRNSFQQQFPNAKDVDWELSGNEYETDFEIDGVEHKACLLYTSDAAD